MCFFKEKIDTSQKKTSVFFVSFFPIFLKTEAGIKVACALEIQLPPRGSSDSISFLEKLPPIQNLVVEYSLRFSPRYFISSCSDPNMHTHRACTEGF